MGKLKDFFKKKYRVIIKEDKKNFEGNKGRYIPGEEVKITFNNLSADAEYVVIVDGAESKKKRIDNQITITFTMPKNDVSISYVFAYPDY